MAKKSAVTLGILGKYYSVRHALGQFRFAGVAGIYRITPPSSSDSESWLQNVLEHALQATIDRHPGLRYAISEDHVEDTVTGFVHLDEIYLEDVADFVTMGEDDWHDGRTPEDVLCQKLELLHSRMWQTGKPAWRMTVLFFPPAKEEKSFRFAVSFIAHHAVADGLSSVAFQKSIMAYLATASVKEDPPTWPLFYEHERMIVPPYIEDNIALSGAEITAQHPPQDNLWSGNRVSLPTLDSFRSRARLITIPANALNQLLQLCRANKVTLTSYLHAQICASLTHRLDGEHSFSAITPYSLRRFTKVSTAEIVNHISYVSSYIPLSKVDNIRRCASGSTAESECIMALACDFNADIQTELSVFPKGSAVANISGIQDLWGHCRSQMNQKREDTYEISNLGAVEDLTADCPNLSLEKLLFTSCGMVTGAAMGFNCVSIKGGPMTITVTWQDGNVSVELVDGLQKDLETGLGVA